jgi:hypothetical protein
MTNYRISSLKKGLIAHYPLNSKSEKVGSELVTSQNDIDFSSGTIGNWTAYNGDGGSGGTVTYDAGPNSEQAGKVTIGGTPGAVAAVLNTTNMSGISTTKEYEYSVRVYIPSGMNFSLIQVSFSGLSTLENIDTTYKDANLGIVDGWQTIRRRFVFGTDVSGDVHVYSIGSVTGDYFYFDDVHIKEVQTADTTPNSNHGTVYGAVQNVSSMEFNGTDNYVEGTELNQIQNSEELTFSGWINLTKNATYQFPIDFYYNLLNRVRFGISSNGFLMVNSEILNDSITSNYDYDISDSWHHITMTRDGSFLKTYVDGVFVNSNDCTHSNSDMPGNAKLYIGSENNNYFCEGSIKDVRIYNRALTAEEVELLYKLNGEDVGLRI